MKSKLATTSFILGIISLLPLIALTFPHKTNIGLAIIFMILFNFLIIPLGIILGGVSLILIKKKQLEGTWFGILGILFSIAGGIISMIILKGIGSAMTSFL